MSNILGKEITNTKCNSVTWRFASTVSAAITFALLLASAILFAALVYIRADRIGYEAQAGALLTSSEDSSERPKSERDTLIETRKHMHLVGSVLLRQDVAGEAIRAILGGAPSGISITDVSFSYKNSVGTVSVNGNTDGRDTVTDFKKALEDGLLFDDVSVPVSYLADAERGRFSMTAKTKKYNENE